jgi:hypothetical protein
LKSTLLAATFYAVIAGAANAQQPVLPLPYPATPLGTGQHNIALTSVTQLNVPGGALLAGVCAKGTGAANYTLDGFTVPSATVGTALAAGFCVPLTGKMMTNFQAINQSGAAITLDVEYSR